MQSIAAQPAELTGNIEVRGKDIALVALRAKEFGFQPPHDWHHESEGGAEAYRVDLAAFVQTVKKDPKEAELIRTKGVIRWTGTICGPVT